ncbi:MAG: LPS-assembly protein LptD [Tannerella sp.]|nr:LPS-assembly protein LptD [Tannerella sp.]
MPFEPLPGDTSLYMQVDTLATDSIAVSDTIPKKKSPLEAPVIYQASDSIVLTAGNMAYLYGEGDVKYQQIQLQSELIEISMDSSVVYAHYGIDSVGMEFGYPLFIEKEQQIEAKIMQYNFGTRKAFAKDVLTQQGEGYLTAGITKKMPDDAMNMKGGMYTTCDEHDHPHFYIKMTKAKARPGKNIVAGPAYLVIEDVPLYPIGLPFAFFPFTSTYSSGILMPTFGDDMNQGFFLRDGGYYFAINDYVDLALRADLYTKGTYGFNARSSYRKRYKYSGSFDASYMNLKTGIKGVDQKSSPSFKVVWSHSQDAKANPYLTLSANVNFSMGQYERNLPNNVGRTQSTENNKGSTVNISKRFPNSPFSISATMSVNQRSQDSMVNVTLPNMMITMSRIFPFKRKDAVGRERWYEKISTSYSGSLQNSITTKEDQLFKSNLIKDWTNGMDHKAQVSATYTMLGYLNISPSFNYEERWFTQKVEKDFVMTNNSSGYAFAPVDTSNGFYRVYNYNASISASTTVYGMFSPMPIFGKKLSQVQIRHKLEPSVSFSVAPDFADPKYGYYNDYTYYPIEGDTLIGGYDPFGNFREPVTGYYSPFDGQLFGLPGRGKQGAISFGLNNNIEAKIPSQKDSTGVRKISIIDNLSLRLSYNMAVDTFQWSDLSMSIRLKLSKSNTLNLNGTFDTYMYKYDEDRKRLNRIDETCWQGAKGFQRVFGRLRSTSWSYTYTFDNNTLKKLFGKKGDIDKTEDDHSESDDDFDENTGEDENAPVVGKRLREPKKDDSGDYDMDGYYKATIPWSLTFNYNMSLGYDYNKINIEKEQYKYTIRHSLSFNGNIQPTKNWRFNFNATYDFDLKKIGYMTCNVTRNLHCFQMTASFVPVGYNKSYSFSIAVSSSLLKDLKYNQSSSYRSGQTWY